MNIPSVKTFDKFQDSSKYSTKNTNHDTLTSSDSFSVLDIQLESNTVELKSIDLESQANHTLTDSVYDGREDQYSLKHHQNTMSEIKQGRSSDESIHEYLGEQKNTHYANTNQRNEVNESVETKDINNASEKFTKAMGNAVYSNNQSISESNYNHFESDASYNSFNPAETIADRSQFIPFNNSTGGERNNTSFSNKNDENFTENFSNLSIHLGQQSENFTEMDDLKNKILTLQKFAQVFENERDFYFDKLVSIERYLMDNPTSTVILERKYLRLCTRRNMQRMITSLLKDN